MQSTKQAEDFFFRLIELFQSHDIPFMVGGTYAFTEYTGIMRPTKDVDFFMLSEDYPRALEVCTTAGYKTELLDRTWIAKVHEEKFTADIIFSERNERYSVNRDWFGRSKKGVILGKEVDLMPVEDMIRSKAYIQFRERYDGADVLNLVLRQGKQMDWNYLLESMDGDWELLLSYVLLFYFVYPGDTDIIPTTIFDTLVKKTEIVKKNEVNERVTRGMLISDQYTVAIEKWGYKELPKR